MVNTPLPRRLIGSFRARPFAATPWPNRPVATRGRRRRGHSAASAIIQILQKFAAHSLQIR